MNFKNMILSSINKTHAEFGYPKIDFGNQFLKSDFCTECNGDGISIDNGEQCLSCEEWHYREVQADIMLDTYREG